MTETVTILGLVQSLFGILIFIFKRPQHLSFIILSIWLAINALFLGAQLLPFQVVDYFKPGVFPLLLLVGPLLFLYVSSLSIENFKLQINQLLHAIPLLLVAIHRSFTPAVSVTAESAFNGQASLNNRIYYILIILSMFVYWIFTVRLILKHRKNIPFYFSNYSTGNTLSWLIFVVFIFLILFLADFLGLYLMAVLNIGFVFTPGISGNLTIFSFIMIFFGIHQSAIYKFREANVPGVKNDTGKKYQRSTLVAEQIEEINASVYEYLKTNKPYLNPEYSLQMMVEDTGISRQHLSQVINSGQKKNFYKLINEFRVEEVKKMLSDPDFDQFTILGNAFECGFNSKTSFNRIFKEVTGLTPSQYKKSLSSG